MLEEIINQNIKLNKELKQNLLFVNFVIENDVYCILIIFTSPIQLLPDPFFHPYPQKYILISLKPIKSKFLLTV